MRKKMPYSSCYKPIAQGMDYPNLIMGATVIDVGEKAIDSRWTDCLNRAVNELHLGLQSCGQQRNCMITRWTSGGIYKHQGMKRYSRGPLGGPNALARRPCHLGWSCGAHMAAPDPPSAGVMAPTFSRTDTLWRTYMYLFFEVFSLNI